MRICLLGDFSSHELDEGMKNVASHFQQELAKKHEVLGLDARQCGKVGFWRQVRNFQPDILHYVAGPSILSLILMKLLDVVTPGSRTIVSAVHPWFPGPTHFLIPFVSPDLMLVQSEPTERAMREKGCRTAYLANGVDHEKFRPRAPAERMALRDSMNIPRDKYVILHVGPVREKRGLPDLLDLHGQDQYVLVVGSPSVRYDRDMITRLEDRGCRVWMNYLPHIEQVYALSDCYVFPTRDSLSAIELPLSILEAMACDLPVLTYPFGAMPHYFAEGEGLLYFMTKEQMVQRLQEIRSSPSVNTREKVLSLGWDAISQELERAYQLVLNHDGST